MQNLKFHISVSQLRLNQNPSADLTREETDTATITGMTMTISWQPTLTGTTEPRQTLIPTRVASKGCLESSKSTVMLSGACEKAELQGNMAALIELA